MTTFKFALFLFVGINLVFAKSVWDAPPTLDLSQYTQGPGQDFTTTTEFNRTVWTNVFDTDGGYHFWFSKTTDIGLMIASSADLKWPQVGFMQTFSTDCTTGFGYGVFHFTASIPASNAKQGFGINLALWNSDGSWVIAKNNNTISEVDILEANVGDGFSTLHYYDPKAPYNDGYKAWDVKDPQTGQTLNLTQWHNYDFLWLDGVMALYIDNHLLYNITGEQVPKDTAHGGCDKTLGAQVVIQVAYEPLPTIQLLLQNMWHYTPNKK